MQPVETVRRPGIEPRDTTEARLFSHMHATPSAIADQDASLDVSVNTLGSEKALDNVVGEGMRFLAVVPPGGTTRLALAHAGWFGADDTLGGHGGSSRAILAIAATYETLTARGVMSKHPVEGMPWGQQATWFSDLASNECFLVAE